MSTATRSPSPIPSTRVRTTSTASIDAPHTKEVRSIIDDPNVEKSAGGIEEMLLTLMPLLDAVVRSTSRNFSKLRVCQAHLIRKAHVDVKVVLAR